MISTAGCRDSDFGGLVGALREAEEENSTAHRKSEFDAMIEDCRHRAKVERQHMADSQEESAGLQKHAASILSTPAMPGAPIAPMAPMPNT